MGTRILSVTPPDAHAPVRPDDNTSIKGR